MNEQQHQQAKRSGRIMMLLGGVLLLVGVLISLLLWMTFLTEGRELQGKSFVTAVALGIPPVIQTVMLLLFICGFVAAHTISCIRKSGKAVNFIGSIPLVISLLLYLPAQGAADITKEYRTVVRADMAALFGGKLLIVCGMVLCVLGLVLTLRRAKRRVKFEGV